MLVKTDKGKTRDVALLDVTPENYICPKGEEMMYHCRIEVRKFDPETGERLSKPMLQKFGRKFFESFGLHNLRKLGYTVDILHDPAKWYEAHKAEAEAAEKARREAAEKAAEEARKAERDALKAEIRAQVLEELKAAQNGKK